jgi:hypothetical protein
MDATAILRQSGAVLMLRYTGGYFQAAIGSVRVSSHVFREIAKDIPKLWRVLNKFVRRTRTFGSG